MGIGAHEYISSRERGLIIGKYIIGRDVSGCVRFSVHLMGFYVVRLYVANTNHLNTKRERHEENTHG